MKKTSLLVTVPALALCGLLLAGCGMFRSHKAWETAVQESPLEIPPGMDTPSATAALNIPPPGANHPTANGARASVANSVALGYASSASRGAQTGYAAYGLSTLQNSAGEVSIGAPGQTHRLTLCDGRSVSLTTRAFY